MELTNEEKTRVLLMHIRGEVIVTEDNETFKGYLTGFSGFDEVEIQRINDDGNVSEHPEFYDVENVNLLLNPFSAITDNHAIALCEAFYAVEVGNTNKIKIVKEQLKLDILEWNVRVQLSLWNYSVPLYFGIGHWANGKNAHELNVARYSWQYERFPTID